MHLLMSQVTLLILHRYTILSQQNGFMPPKTGAGVKYPVAYIQGEIKVNASYYMTTNFQPSLVRKQFYQLKDVFLVSKEVSLFVIQQIILLFSPLLRHFL